MKRYPCERCGEETFVGPEDCYPCWVEERQTSRGRAANRAIAAAPLPKPISRYRDDVTRARRKRDATISSARFARRSVRTYTGLVGLNVALIVLYGGLFITHPTALRVVPMACWVVVTAINWNVRRMHVRTWNERRAEVTKADSAYGTALTKLWDVEGTNPQPLAPALPTWDGPDFSNARTVDEMLAARRAWLEGKGERRSPGSPADDEQP